ncbi:MAG: hypothetical protein H2172_12260 [Opitutus sp.]|nr:hypothetical protein [Opitutus sp.]MCS6248258.1 hypothetical protein [Opitutus sp.]MCS6274932.1 hypothetical protein [Opitutus sp.]MCS6299831.1 hypothetical protein [Opitutus sp.]
MASFKSYPVFYSLLAALGLAAVGSGWCIYERSQAAHSSAKALAKKRLELTALTSSQPTPSEENKALVNTDLTRSIAALGQMRAELKGSGPAAEALLKAKAAYTQAATLKSDERSKLLREAKVPFEPTHLFFNIATFVELMRDNAQAAKIKIKADERFGFTTYANAGPERDLIPLVYRQRQVAEYLLGALFQAAPSELVSFQRERPTDSVNPAKPAARSGTAAPATNNDLFEMDSRITARVPGFVDASAFRLTFIGDTASLRALLNKLATFELPLVVRGVEVDPIIKVQAPEKVAPANTLSSIFGNTPAAAAVEPVKPKPLVEKVLSKFTVTVELIDLVDNTPTQATPTP